MLDLVCIPWFCPDQRQILLFPFGCKANSSQSLLPFDRNDVGHVIRKEGNTVTEDQKTGCHGNYMQSVNMFSVSFYPSGF